MENCYHQELKFVRDYACKAAGLDPEIAGWKTAVDAMTKQLADAQATVEALQRERDAWKGRYEAAQALVNGAYEENGELRTALDAEREKVRTVEHELARIVKRNQGGYIGDRIAIDKCLTIIRTLDATTPDAITVDQVRALNARAVQASKGGDGE